MELKLSGGITSNKSQDVEKLNQKFEKMNAKFDNRVTKPVDVAQNGIKRMETSGLAKFNIDGGFKLKSLKTIKKAEFDDSHLDSKVPKLNMNRVEG